MSKTYKELQEEWLVRNKPTQCKDDINKLFIKVNTLGQIEIHNTETSKRVRKLSKY